MASYEPPSWSSAPQGDFSLEVLKDGVIVSDIKLTKSFYILGRQPDVVDIQMDHPSLSRRHAVLNFRDDNALMLKDLNSAQGTFLNKNRCEKDVYHRVYVGDMIRFGASTRQYILNGPDDQRPPEYESENVVELRKKIEEKNAERAKRKEAEANEGIGWGFREDAEEVFSDEDEKKEDVDLPDYLKKNIDIERKYNEKFEADIRDEDAVNDKDKAILDKIRKKEMKIQHMQEENRRIFNKESSQDEGLTDGQSKALARNDAQIEKLTSEVEELVQTIKSKNLQRTVQLEAAQSSSSASKRVYQDVSDDIEFDTTDVTADASTNWRMRKKLAKTQSI